MPHQLISLLKEGDAVQQYFLVRQAETRMDKSGNPYLSLALGDKSGSMVARVWDKVKGPNVPGLSPREIMWESRRRLSPTRENFSSTSVISIAWRPCRDLGRDLQEYDPELLCQATPYDREALWQELWQLAETQIGPPLGELVLRVLDRYREEFQVCPAALRYHHPYLGGLLEHTWFVTRHALASLTIYPELNRDLVLAGAILHDLGKVKELANPPAPERTVPGHLLGHVVLGWEMVRSEAQALNFSDPILLVQLEHIILSHHGSMEFGSPILPKTREALLVNFLDDLDAKLR